jgi:hypothetical protein
VYLLTVPTYSTYLLTYLFAYSALHFGTAFSEFKSVASVLASQRCQRAGRGVEEKEEEEEEEDEEEEEEEEEVITKNFGNYQKLWQLRFNILSDQKIFETCAFLHASSAIACINSTSVRKESARTATILIPCKVLEGKPFKVVSRCCLFFFG